MSITTPSKQSNSSEVHVPKKRRAFSEAYKRRILDQLDACSVLGDKGVLLRREELYNSTVTRWRQHVAKKTKDARGGPRKSPLQSENEKLKRQLEELQGRLERAETIIDVQKKLSMLL